MIIKKISDTKEKISNKYRQITAANRALPDFIVVGAQKAGTTSLFSYLSRHPQIIPANKKEIHFFDGGLNPAVDNFSKGVEWYRSHFPSWEKMDNGIKTFEASPLYLFNPLAPERIHKMLPGVKLIAVLRDPSERAVSHYFHESRKKREDLPVMQALKAEESRIRDAVESKNYKSHSFIHHSYKSRGLYKEQLERYYKIFPEKQIKVISSDKLFNETKEILRELFEFIGVDTGIEISDTSPKHVSKNKKKPVSEVYDYLKDYFYQPNRELYQFLGRDFGWQK